MSRAFKKTLLLLGDIATLYVALLATLFIRYREISNVPLVREHLIPFSILFFVWLVIFYIHNLYDLTSAKNTLEFYTALLKALVINLGIAVFFFYFIPFFAITPKRNLFIFLVIFFILFAIWRQGINRTLKSRLNSNTIILGSGQRVFDLAEILNKNPQVGYKVVTLFTTIQPLDKENLSFNVKTQKDFPSLAELTKKHEVQTVVVEGQILENKYVAAGLHNMLEFGIEVIDLDDFEEGLKRKVLLDNINELWFLKYVAKGRRITYDAVKRIADIIVSILVLPLSAVLGITIALLIKLENGNEPVFYTQTRIGKLGKHFTMIKFRTMGPDAEKDGAQWTIENDDRVTRVGRLLRKTRLDELPQIINILRGEMSYVGPRAERPEFHSMLKKELPFYENRYLIKPGLTGWAQINYTYGSSVDDTRQKLAYDFYYLKNRSFIFDIGIILKTIDLVLGRRGR